MQPREQLMAFMHHLGGETSRRAGGALGHAATTNWRIFKNALAKLYDFLVPLFIQWPTVEEANHEANLVHERYGFPKSVFLFADGSFFKGIHKFSSFSSIYF